MPDFARADTAARTLGLSPSVAIVKKRSPGETVSLPLEKRASTTSEEAERARVEKARDARLRRRTEPSPAADAGGTEAIPADETTGTNTSARPDTTQVEAPVETDQGHPGEAPGEPLSEDPVTHELVPPEQQVREPDAGAAPPRRSTSRPACAGSRPVRRPRSRNQ